MAYRFKPGTRAVGKALRRIAAEQVDKAIAELEDGDLAAPVRVHQARKRLKKLRGLVRLVRPVFPAGKRENAACREIASALSPYRDDAVMTNVYDALCAANAGGIDRPALAPVRRALTGQRSVAADTGDIDAALTGALDALREMRARIDGWHLSQTGFAALGKGLAATYGAARDGLDRAVETPAGPERVEALHAWRKQVKYHSQHARLLALAWPEATGPHIAAARALAAMLGEHHDACVFAERMADPAAGPVEARGTLAVLATRRAAALEQDSLVLGRRLFADKPKALKRRWRIWWKSAADAEKMRKAPAASHAAEVGDEGDERAATKGWFGPSPLTRDSIR
ncbi:CHAD domain-containing protein [Pararhizobium haloflavum]|uniref:CHAD domain-containing protein n=1 Tax=Pararhizobium haloflavum TaxID=2037914 RepID=UPI000C17C5F1|nr:CHAD domain-containing protein [Pararhizobium haloflavum]